VIQCIPEHTARVLLQTIRHTSQLPFKEPFMVTILKPLHKHVDERPDIADENLPGNADLAQQERGKDSENVPKGVELDDEVGNSGTGSAPGEGPNPTA
jgi:hypothetical protein